MDLRKAFLRATIAGLALTLQSISANAGVCGWTKASGSGDCGSLNFDEIYSFANAAQGIFSNKWSFSTAADGFVNAQVTGLFHIVTPGTQVLGIDKLGLEIRDSSNNIIASEYHPGTAFVQNVAVQGGQTYYVTVTGETLKHNGNPLPATYGGWIVAAVPEPEIIGMLVGGLAAGGWIVRRRNASASNDAPPATT